MLPRADGLDAEQQHSHIFHRLVDVAVEGPLVDVQLAGDVIHAHALAVDVAEVESLPPTTFVRVEGFFAHMQTAGSQNPGFARICKRRFLRSARC